MHLKRFPKKKVSGIAVVDVNNKLVGTLSSTDLCVVHDPWTFQYLRLHIMEFLKHTNPKSREPSACYVTSSIDTVLFHMAQEKIHRMFIVDSEYILKGIITLTDLMELCMYEPIQMI